MFEGWREIGFGKDSIRHDHMLAMPRAARWWRCFPALAP